MKSKTHLPFIVLFTLLVTSAFSLSLPGIAAETGGVEIVSGDVGAYLIDHNPAGVSVRSGPGMEYPVIATLPTDPGATADPMVSVYALITGYTGKWVRIEGIEIYEESKEVRQLNIVGWVTGPVFALRAKAYGRIGAVVPLYEGPDTKSPVLTRLQSDAEAVVVGCRGDWVKVNYMGIEGWLEPGTYCNLELTNCCRAAADCASS